MGVLITDKCHGPGCDGRMVRPSIQENSLQVHITEHHFTLDVGSKARAPVGLSGVGTCSRLARSSVHDK